MYLMRSAGASPSVVLKRAQPLYLSLSLSLSRSLALSLSLSLAGSLFLPLSRALFASSARVVLKREASMGRLLDVVGGSGERQMFYTEMNTTLAQEV